MYLRTDTPSCLTHLKTYYAIAPLRPFTFYGDIPGLPSSVGKIEAEWRDVEQIPIMMMRRVDLLRWKLHEALSGNDSAERILGNAG